MWIWWVVGISLVAIAVFTVVVANKYVKSVPNRKYDMSNIKVVSFHGVLPDEEIVESQNYDEILDLIVQKKRAHLQACLEEMFSDRQIAIAAAGHDM